MRSKLVYSFGVLALGAALLSSAGCGGPHYYRAYDPYYGDYHRWDAHEDVYYHQWEGDTHRDHREFRDRKADEQKEYYTWRHSHHDDDHHDDHHK